MLVCPDVDLKAAAATVGQEKIENAGQVCTGINTIFVPQGRGVQFVELMQAAVRARWGGRSGREGMGQAEQYCSIVNERHYERVKDMLDDAKNLGCKVWGPWVAPACLYASLPCHMPPYHML